MKKTSRIRNAFAAAAFALPAAAFAFGGTEEQTIAAGGSLNYQPGTANGSSLEIEARGGYYLDDGFLVGGVGSFFDDDYSTTYEIAAYCQYHWLRLFSESNDRPLGFSPYVGARLGLAHGKNGNDDGTGALAAARLGLEIFFTENVAFDIFADFAVCTSDVYPDDNELKSSDSTIRAGLTFHF